MDRTDDGAARWGVEWREYRLKYVNILEKNPWTHQHGEVVTHQVFEWTRADGTVSWELEPMPPGFLMHGVPVQHLDSWDVGGLAITIPVFGDTPGNLGMVMHDMKENVNPGAAINENGPKPFYGGGG